MTTAVRKFLATGPSDQLGWAVAVSLGLHLLLVVAMMFGQAVLPSKREIFSPVYNVQLVGSPGPPAAAPPAPPAPKLVPSPEVKPEPKPAPKPVKEAIVTKPPDKPESKKPESKPEVKEEPKVDASQELAKRLESLKAKVEEQRRYDQALSKLEKKVATQANTVGGAFSSAAPGSSSNVSIRDQVYLAELWERIQRNWILSEVLVQKPKGLVAIVMMRIRKDGVLERAWLEQSSGNQRYDESALRATEKASPFPPLSAGTSGSYEVGVRFRVEDITG